LVISTSFGNILASTNPRNFYSGVEYFIRHMNEQHTQTIATLLSDFNQEIYVPETWSELIYKADDFQAKIFTMILGPFVIAGYDNINVSIAYRKLSNTFFYRSYGGYVDNMPFYTKVFSPSVNSAIAATTSNLGITYTNYLIEPRTIVKRKSDNVWVNIAASSFDSATYVSSFGDNIIGQIKPTVVNNLMGTDISGNVGYFMLGTCVSVIGEFAFSQLMVDYFTSIQAKYIVYDVRINPGGTLTWALIPFGASGQANRTTYRNSICAGDYSQFKSKTLPSINYLDFVALSQAEIDLALF
jgi:hypothetical protein